MTALSPSRLLVASLFVLAGASSAHAAAPASGRPMLGDPKANVTVRLFFDAQCPFCRKVWPDIVRLQKQNPGKVRVYFHHLPLPFHPRAVPAAIASEAAHRQGRFVPFMDALMSEEAAGLGDDEMLSAAKAAGLDPVRFAVDLRDASIAAAVERDARAADAIGIHATPSTLVSGIGVAGAQPLAVFEKAVQMAWEAAQATPGLSPDALELKGVERSAAPAAEGFRRFVQGDETPPPLARRPATGKAPPVSEQGPPSRERVTVHPGDARRGPEDALVTVVMFSDFQCPFCARAAQTLKAVLAENPDVRAVFKHFPLPFHKLAFPAALVADAARRRGQFWAFYDAAFSTPGAFGEEQLFQAAQAAGLGRKEVEAALGSPDGTVAVQRDMREGALHGVRGTPVFFINGQPLQGAQPKSAIDKAIGAARQEAKALVAKGTPREKIYETVWALGRARDPVEADLDDAEDMGSLDAVPAAGAEATKARVTLTLLIDIKCPHCKHIWPAVQRVARRHASDARVVLAFVGTNGRSAITTAHSAVVAAGLQGRLLEMTGALYAVDGEVTTKSVRAAARKLKLDGKRLERDMQGMPVRSALEAGAALAQRLQVDETPTLFFNGRFYRGDLAEDHIEAAVTYLLKKGD